MKNMKISFTLSIVVIAIVGCTRLATHAYLSQDEYVQLAERFAARHNHIATEAPVLETNATRLVRQANGNPVVILSYQSQSNNFMWVVVEIEMTPAGKLVSQDIGFHSNL